MSDTDLVLRHSKHLLGSGLDDRGLRRAAERGELVRVASGTFIPAGVWSQLTDAERSALRTVTALRRIDPLLIASHLSAAAIWGLPDRDGWPDAVHVIDTRRSTGNSTPALVRHALPVEPDEVATHSGIRLTNATRTAVDVALIEPFATALMTFDHGLRHDLFTRESAHLQLDRRPAARRRRSARRALELASPLAGSPAESLSRAVMIEGGVPAPVLQQPFRDARGKIGDVDFWWPEFGVIGEMDGNQKYLDPGMLGGRTPAQAVIDEKRREDRLRAVRGVRTVVRWGYRDVEESSRLVFLLAQAGVVASSPRRRPRTSS